MQSARTSTASRALAVSIACILALFGACTAATAAAPEKAHASLTAGTPQHPYLTFDNGETVLTINIDWVVEYEDSNGKRLTVKSEKMRQALLKRGINVNIGDTIWFGNDGSIKVVSSSTGKTYTGGYSTPVARTSIAYATVKISNVKYNGKAKKPNPVVRYHGTRLKKGRDYTVTYSNNVNPGTAIATIIGKGRFAGTTAAYFKITGKKKSNSLSYLMKAKKHAKQQPKPVVVNVALQADRKKMSVLVKNANAKQFGKYLVATKVWVEKYGSEVFGGNGTTYSKSAKLSNKKTLKVRAAAVVIDQNTGKVKYTGKKSRSYKVKVPAQLRKTKGKTKLSISLYHGDE